MAFCKNCGSQIDDKAVICPHCGVEQIDDKGGFLWGLLGFLVPIAGLVLYLVWKDTKPKTAKATGIGALASVIVSVTLTVLYILFILFIGFGIFSMSI